MLAPLTDADPRTVGTYRLQGRLGAGGMGAVYLGFGPDSRPAALKIIRPDLAADPEFRARFRREVAAARRICGSFIAEVRDADVEAEQPWMAIEYVEGVSLATAVANRSRLDGPMLINLAAGLADALIVVHEAGLVHRDLKPSNILLAWDGPKVIDFGIARDLDSTDHTRTGDVIGTARWMAPEQLLGERAGPPADVFSWAMCVVFAATGRQPFAGDTPVASTYRTVHAEPNLDGVPESLRPLLRRALAKVPGQRPSAVDLVSELLGQKIIGGVDAEEGIRRLSSGWAPPTPPPPPIPPPASTAPPAPATANPTGGPDPAPTSVVSRPAGPQPIVSAATLGRAAPSAPALDAPSPPAPAPSPPAPASPPPAPAPLLPAPSSPAPPLPAPLPPPPDVLPGQSPSRYPRLALVAVAVAVLLAAGAGLAMVLTPGDGPGDDTRTGADTAATLRTVSGSPSPSAGRVVAVGGTAAPGTPTASPTTSPPASAAGSGVVAGGARNTADPERPASRGATIKPTARATAGAPAPPARTAPIQPAPIAAAPVEPNGGKTSQLVHHAAGNGAGQIWFNSGTANLSKGRNSFTVKDIFCGDDWSLYVQYTYRDQQGTAREGSKYLSGDCAPVEWSGSIAGDQPAALAFRWRGCKWDTNRKSADSCEPWVASTLR